LQGYILTKLTSVFLRESAKCRLKQGRIEVDSLGYFQIRSSTVSIIFKGWSSSWH